MTLTEHAQSELERAGLFDKDSDYEGGIGESVMELVRCFAEQGHSGFSAARTLQIFKQVASYRTLTPLGNPTETREYIEVADGVWQSTRDPAVFSDNLGKSWYHLDTHRRPWQKALAFIRKHTPIPVPFRWIRGKVA